MLTTLNKYQKILDCFDRSIEVLRKKVFSPKENDYLFYSKEYFRKELERKIESRKVFVERYKREVAKFYQELS